MADLDPNNIIEKDPGDKVYVSKKHWARKTKVEKDKGLSSIIGRPGPITGIALSIVDVIVYYFLKFSFYIFDITTYAFNWVGNITFGNFLGIIPSSLKKGKVISTKFFRYTITVLMPPFGIVLSKGLFGWFSVLVCILITYVNFIAGIIYAFVITSRNRYADQYEIYQRLQYEKIYPQTEADEDISAFVSSLFVVILIVGTFILFFGYF